MNKFFATLRVLVCTAALSLCAPRADASFAVLPAVVLNNTSAMVLYFTGKQEAMEQILYRQSIADQVTVSNRTASKMNHGSAFYWLPFSPHVAAYLFGRADAYNEAANAAGEPDDA